ncbi:diguanylate cyclase (GGDEF)-like protein [Marinomonas alcarazii]|uniref:Diguanylate cyclase (GGDEF)-like protein n=1 Tax=Marinomonas alcarazii TaxID=491949 RepID=A0A318V3M6_9GAMM|nr:GGDEF domain-containing protein [Marinomonas alcarazii]PYF82380.1 diguanylate cyclase (GGDEF)-like protein [Marinomonas alcarazii]
MSIDTLNIQSEQQQTMLSRIACLEKERDFIKKLYSDMPHMLQTIAKGAVLSSLLDSFRVKMQAQLPNAYCLFLTSDKDCLQWRLQYTDAVNAALLTPNSLLSKIPQALVTFAASPSCPIRHEENIQTAAGWKVWHSFIDKQDFSDVSMVSVSDGKGTIYLLAVFQQDRHRLADDLVTLALDSYASWLSAVFEREQADLSLLEDSHRDPTTGLLRRHSFENSFNIILKDARRHFLRAAVFSIKILSSSAIKDAELKILAEVMQETVRDNDLIAYFGGRQLVMGIRIQNLADAEIVAQKLLQSLNAKQFSGKSLLQGGLSIGIAFYPEHSSLDALYSAATSAADSLKNTPGYRMEFHGKYFQSSTDFYTL